MPYINPNLKEHVAALVAKLPGDDEPTFQGTCFFVQVTNSTGRVFDYLVTARHVEDALRRAGGGAAVRVNKGPVGQFNLGTQDLRIPTEGWLHHEDASVDLAALSLGSDAQGTSVGDDVVRFLKLRLDRLTDTRPPGIQWPPKEAEDVLFLAMTSQFKGVRANLPLVRKGSIALVTDEFLEGKYGPSQYYVVQGQVYPGNSGSPIWLIHDTTSMVMLGVLVFSYPTEEELRRSVTGKVDYDVYQNYGLALVVPIEKVLEMINCTDETARREAKRGSSHMPGEAVSARPQDEQVTTTTLEAFDQALRDQTS